MDLIPVAHEIPWGRILAIGVPVGFFALLVLAGLAFIGYGEEQIAKIPHDLT
ncbi:MAG: hypothetical protein KBD44_02340 [Candidatus Pacebacteria bacterium]|jgi:hypothetical protein|nr:hypothetical protein [Candidatus Paceibacterota bacterium]